MDAKRVVEMLSNRDIFDLLVELDAEPLSKGDVYECKTVCHCGSKRKLLYYKESKQFYCYTNCGSMSIFDMVSKTLEVEFIDALRYITKKYNLRDEEHFEGFQAYKVENPGEELRKKLQKIEMPVFKELDKNILNDFYSFYHKDWLKDGIKIPSMKKYNIKYDIVNNQIIIPHYDSNGRLIGVRGRNLNKDLVEAGKKYMPIYYEGKVLKHLTGANLYGLNLNKDQIEKSKTAILFESEKSVLQLDTMFPNQSIGLCVSGSSLTTHQLEILKKLNIEEVIIGMDKEFKEIGDEEEILYAEKILRVFKRKLAPYFRTSVLWDTKNLLDTKMSPVDAGKDVFLELLKNKIYI